LESVEGPQKLAEFSFIGFDPKQLVTIKNGNIEIFNEEKKIIEKTDDPLKFIKKSVFSNKSLSNHFRLLGGAVGYFSYDAIRYWEDLPNKAVDDLGLPDIEMGIYDNGIVFDHLGKKAYYYSMESDESNLKKRLQKITNDKKESLAFNRLKTNICKNDFEDSVKKAKQYISDGDIFQVVLSKRFEFDFKGNLLKFYRILRKINPSPYMFFLKYGNRQIL